MSGRRLISAKAKYGFNGKLKDNEDCGEGNTYDYGDRIYNTRLGKFLSVDPIFSKYPELSTYQFASNRPIDGIDKDGNEYENIKSAWKVVMFGIDALKIKKIDDGFGNVQSQLYTLKANGNSADFAKLKEVMTNTPEKITNNFYGSYSAFQKADPKTLSAGDEIKIDIAALPAPVFVRVMNVQSDEKSFSMTFATLEGHAEAGYITFSGILNDNGTIEVNIFNETRENFGAGAIGPSRPVQIDQWEDVMGNIKSFLGNDSKGKSKTTEMTEHIEEYEYDEEKPMGKGKMVDSTTDDINE